MTTRHTSRETCQQLYVRLRDRHHFCRWPAAWYIFIFLLVQTSAVSAAHVDLLIVIDKNGTDYTLQQTISPQAALPEAGPGSGPDSGDRGSTRADITLDDKIRDAEIIFLGPDRQRYLQRYANQTASPTRITIDSGSVVIRYRHTLAGRIDLQDSKLFKFPLSLVSAGVRFSDNSAITHSATIVLPEDLEFAYSSNDSANTAGNRSGQPRRSISVRTTGEEAFRFPVRYRHVDQDQDGIADASDLCPGSATAALVDRSGCEPDADRDGITDIVDICPHSSPGAVVDDKGCEADADHDGLPDRFDQCDDTPENFAIAPDGCNLDSDGDGVADGEDQCPDSDPAEPVARDGCSLDFDQDGVPNFRDQCGATSYGRSVGKNGCETDTDTDGIPDRLDACESSPASIEVDETGCAFDSDSDSVPDYRDICLQNATNTVITPVAFGCSATAHWRDKDHLVLEGVGFSTGSAFLTAEARRVLNKVARALIHHRPDEFEVGAHTDNSGDASYNLQLSQRRAETVRQYLMVRGVSPNRIIAKGFGEAEPIKRNTTTANREKNRRIELRKVTD